jgi:hypothetical protein
MPSASLHSSRRFLLRGALVLLVAFCALPSAFAQYEIGSPLVAVADPPVPHPNTTPCTVTLFTNQEFADFNNQPFSYSPTCGAGPWAKVVLEGDYYITPGVQYDRTSEIFLNNVSIFFGTTPENPATVNDPWHFERDLTDYSALLSTAQSGFASLGNLVNSEYTGIIYGTATVYFYPAAKWKAPPITPTQVLAVNGAGAATLNASGDTLSTAFTLPTNITHAYLDVTAESQNEEEQWFYCLPTNVAGEFYDCPNTAFREVEVSIDGTPAGVAPVSPWIYTGGVDPFLWFPTPGNQTLNFKPFRVDLSPFAGVLSNGASHTVGIQVFNAYEYFSVTGTLLLYQDNSCKSASGAVTVNTLTLPNPNVVENLQTDSSGDITGTVSVSSKRHYTISGYVNTPHGRVTNTVDADVNFANNTTLADTATIYTQNADQHSSITVTSKSSDHGWPSAHTIDWTFPINIALTQTYDPDSGNIAQVTTSKQHHTGLRLGSGGWDWWPTGGYADNLVFSTDDLLLVPCDGGYCIGGTSATASHQTYSAFATDGYCYFQKVASEDNLLSSTQSVPWCSSAPQVETRSGPTASAESHTAAPHASTTLRGPLVKKYAAAAKSK